MKPYPMPSQPPKKLVPPGEDQPDLAELARLDWLFQQFDKLGFTPTDTILLVHSRADHHDVKRMIENGATHKQVLKILT